MKGQHEILGAVLIASILIFAVSAAYLWGLPIIEKARDRTNIEKAAQNMKSLANAIENVADNKGSRELNFAINGIFVVRNDSIDYILDSKSKYITTGNWARLNEDDHRGTFLSPDGYGLIGIDKPAILFARADGTAGRYVNTFKIDFRELEDLKSKFGSKIAISGVYGNFVTGSKVVVSFDKEEVIPGASKSKGDLKIIYLVVRVL